MKVGYINYCILTDNSVTVCNYFRFSAELVNLKIKHLMESLICYFYVYALSNSPNFMRQSLKTQHNIVCMELIFNSKSKSKV